MISNVCRANFNGGRTAQGNNRFQWDYGQILEISGIENLPDPFTAQFSNYPVLGTAKTAVGTGGRVEIPNEYFVSGQNIYCFIVLHTDEDDGRTVYIATIPVTKRPKPVDDPITPTQQSTIDTAIAALQAGVAKAEGFAGDAEEQATIATGAATTATEAAETATGAVADVEAAATRAETAAGGAEASATAADAAARSAGQSAQTAQDAMNGAVSAAESASDSAQDADTARQAAQEAERDAQAAKTAAEASATAAAGSASAASGSASQAAQKASEAASSATAAQTSATNAEAARTGAEAAQEAAETAQGKAEEAEANAEQSATTAEWYAERVERFLPTDTASGEIASFPDGADGVPMQSVVVSMEPVQDLHGQDAPYPAGGGVNKFDAESVYNSGYTRSGETFTNTVTDTRTSFSLSVQAYNGSTFVANGDSAKTVSGRQTTTIKIPSEVTLLRMKHNGATRDIRMDIPWTAQGEWTISLVVVNDDPTTIGGLVLKDIMIASGTVASPYAPYENLCPISGRTGADIEHTGVNVWDEEWESGGYNISGKAWGDTYWRCKNPVDVVSGESYFFKRPSTISTVYMYGYDSNMGNGTSLSLQSEVLTVPSGVSKVGFFFAKSAYGETYNHDISINYPSIDHDYHAYQGETISVSWESEAGTVYGGTLDVVSGELVVDRAMVDLGTLSWYYVTNDGDPYYYTNLGNKKVNSLNMVCSAYKTASTTGTNYLYDMEVGASSSNIRVFVKDSRYTDAQDFKTAVTGQTLVYELSTPQTYQLTPQEVRTLLGTNNVWSDAGDVTVTYKADVQLYIGKRISEAVSALS